MAVFSFGSQVRGGNMETIDIGGLFDYDDASWGSSFIKLFDDSRNFTQFSGKNLDVKVSGTSISSISGTMTGVKYVVNGSTVLTLSDASVSASKLAQAAFSGKYDLFLSLAMGGNDTVNGTRGADTLTGYAGNDTLKGGLGSDTLKGGAGIDKLIGGSGADDLYGGLGADTFVFATKADSKFGGMDTIYDFSGASKDRIDVSAIDANDTLAGKQDFSFIGSKDFTGKAGQLRVEKLASDTYVYADTNGDKQADFAIHLDDAVTLSKGLFIL